MHALVTGAGGFIGGVLVEELTARGHGVRGLFLGRLTRFFSDRVAAFVAARKR